MPTARDRFKMIASSYLLCIRDDMILLSRRHNTGYEDGNYSLPAGHVEDDELLTAAAAGSVGTNHTRTGKQGAGTM
ncbi:hypothetical protein A2875_01995 [Candidatus Gottesmanbacteria bacterium RIFCSPHIGHO2_01_FULL_46_14]|uniref:Nudix hydrolase domain-containing protein n=2 Tax=Candidatus Gottesmaniibacteriota TaxID=1752720 RepID=A0A1F5ZPN5_9BACT|nr:MAG: hypothetical protein A2875_01995 [Candidatus Gottesmanbacteria bacterium RIFCSPHIGHO2_01_FULL_46_14]OGG28572.1 MAG: hypothetical protein A2971_01615 [Candidatus Gottesmanbacteria bacterium RIFCSPLOWO2_01_FULL_46_21]